MIIEDSFPQNSPEWFAAKLGKPSASKFKKIITPEGKVSKQREGYLYKLAGEAISGYREPEHQTQEMKDGIEREHGARVYFEKLSQKKVRQVGLVYKDKKKEVLCSPDGLREEHRWGLEIKNRNISNHTKCLLEQKVHYDSIVQVQGSIWICNFTHWVYFSYHPAMGRRQVVIRVEADKPFIAKLSQEVDAFCRELKDVIKKLKKL